MVQASRWPIHRWERSNRLLSMNVLGEPCLSGWCRGEGFEAADLIAREIGHRLVSSNSAGERLASAFPRGGLHLGIHASFEEPASPVAPRRDKG